MSDHNSSPFGENYTYGKEKPYTKKTLDEMDGKGYVDASGNYQALKPGMKSALAVDEKKIMDDAGDQAAARSLQQKGLEIADYAAFYRAEIIGRFLEAAAKVGNVDEPLRKDLDAVCKKLEEFKTEFP